MSEMKVTHYAAEALAHEFIATVYSALNKRDMSIAQVTRLMGWPGGKLNLMLKNARGKEIYIEDMAEILYALGYALHFTLSGFVVEPLKKKETGSS